VSPSDVPSPDCLAGVRGAGQARKIFMPLIRPPGGDPADCLFRRQTPPIVGESGPCQSQGVPVRLETGHPAERNFHEACRFYSSSACSPRAHPGRRKAPMTRGGPSPLQRVPTLRSAGRQDRRSSRSRVWTLPNTHIVRPFGLARRRRRPSMTNPPIRRTIHPRREPEANNSYFESNAAPATTTPGASTWRREAPTTDHHRHRSWQRPLVARRQTIAFVSSGWPDYSTKPYLPIGTS